VNLIGPQTAAHQAAFIQLQNDHIIQQNMMRRRLASVPAHAAVAQVAEELVRTPPTDEELRVLTDLGTVTEALVVRKIEAQLEGTRILELLRMLVAKTNITIGDCIVILIMIYQTYLMLNPPQPAPQPAPQVTVNVTVDPNEIAREVARRLKQEGYKHATQPDPKDREHE
jgi:hypothetical protein